VALAESIVAKQKQAKASEINQVIVSELGEVKTMLD
jgi:hypothetical protein